MLERQRKWLLILVGIEESIVGFKLKGNCWKSQKLRSFDVREDSLQMFYTATISSVLTFWMNCFNFLNKNRLDNNSQAGRWGGEEKTRKHRHGLSSISDKQTKDRFGWWDAPTQTWIWHQTHRQKQTYLGFPTVRLQDTYSYSFQRPFRHTVNKQEDKQSKQRLEMGMRRRRGWDEMEEWLGVNGRQLFVQVDRNFEEWKHALLVQCVII